MSSNNSTILQGKPWFPSGDVILLAAGNVGFRVHKDLMESFSVVFKELFAENAAKDTGYGCKVYEVKDSAEELGSLFAVIIGGEDFHSRNTADFIFAGRVLCMCKKYKIQSFGTRALRHISGLFPHTLERYDFCNQNYVVASAQNKDPWPHVHPSIAIELSRYVEVQFLLPCAYLRMVLKPAEKRFPDASGKVDAAVLQSDELMRLSIFESRIIEQTLKVVRSFGKDHKPAENCSYQDNQNCVEAFRSLKIHIRNKVIDDGRLRNPLGLLKQTVTFFTNTSVPSACSICKTKYSNDINRLRQTIWFSLPTMLGLPNWNELIPAEYLPLREG